MADILSETIMSTRRVIEAVLDDLRGVQGQTPTDHVRLSAACNKLSSLERGLRDQWVEAVRKET